MAFSADRQQRLDVRFQLVPVRLSDVALVDRALPVQDEGGGKSHDAAESLLRLLAAQERDVLNMGLLVESRKRLGILVHGDPDDGDSLVLVLPMKVVQPGDGHAAGRTPGGPEIHHSNRPLILLELYVASAQSLPEGEIEAHGLARGARRGGGARIRLLRGGSGGGPRTGGAGLTEQEQSRCEE